MANITTLKMGTITSPHATEMDNTRVYTVDNVIDYAEALTAKGSALASSDTIEALVLPVGTVVLACGVEQIVAGNSTTLTLDVGFTGGDVDEFVDGFDAQAEAVGVYSPALDTASPQFYVIGATGDTIDVLFATLTGTLSAGKVRVWAVIADVSGGSKRQPGLAAIQS